MTVFLDLEVLFFVSFVLSGWSQTPVTVCPESSGWLPSDHSSCILVSSERNLSTLTWKQASDKCRNLHSLAYLATLQAGAVDMNTFRRLRLNTPYWTGTRVPFSLETNLPWQNGIPETSWPHFIGSTMLTGSHSQLCGHVTLMFSLTIPVNHELTWTLDDCKHRHAFLCMLDQRISEPASSETQHNALFGARHPAASEVMSSGSLDGEAFTVTPRVTTPETTNHSHTETLPTDESTKTPVTTAMASRSDISTQHLTLIQTTVTNSLTYTTAVNKASTTDAKQLDLTNDARQTDITTDATLLALATTTHTLPNEHMTTKDTNITGLTIIDNTTTHIITTDTITNTTTNFRTLLVTTTDISPTEITTKYKSSTDVMPINTTVDVTTTDAITSDSSEIKTVMTQTGSTSGTTGTENQQTHHITKQTLTTDTRMASTSSHTLISAAATTKHALTTGAASVHPSVTTLATTQLRTTREITTQQRTTDGITTQQRTTDGITTQQRTTDRITTQQRTTDRITIQERTTDEISTNVTTDSPTTEVTTSSATDAGHTIVFPATTPRLMPNGLQCPSWSALDCLLDAAHRILRGEMTHHEEDQLMATSDYLMDELNRLVVSRSIVNSSRTLTTYVRVLDILLSVSFRTSKPLQSQRIDNTLAKVGHFVESVMLSAGAPDRHEDIRLTLVHSDLQIFQENVWSMKGRKVEFNSGEVTIDDIHCVDRNNDTTQVIVTALLMHVPASEVTLGQQQSKSKAVVASHVLSLTAAVENVKVNLTHTFTLRVPSLKNMDHICGFQRESNNETIWDTSGCQTRLNSTLSQTVNISSDQSLNDSEWNSTMDGAGDDRGQRYVEWNKSGKYGGWLRNSNCFLGQTFLNGYYPAIEPITAKDELVLSIITYIGCSITMITQVIAITVFTCIRSLNSERVCIHRNLCISIMAAQVTFISGIKAIQDRVVCAVVAIILHYFYTTTFMWMLVEGLHLYNMIVKVFGTETSRIFYYTCFGYGLPVLLVVISAAIDWEGYGTKDSCWLSTQRSTIWAFVGPAIAILLVNFVILAVVIRIVVTSAKTDKNNDLDHVRAGIKATLFLLPLLGLTWIFGLVAVNENLVIFQYIFAILNTLQGFFIFMCHCVFNSEVRHTLRRMREKRSIQKGEFLNTMSTNDRPTSSASRSPSSVNMTFRNTGSSAFRKINQVGPTTICSLDNEISDENWTQSDCNKSGDLTTVGV